MRYVLLSFLLACGTGAPGGLLGGDGNGLVVMSGDDEIGVLLDIEETTGVWKVWNNRDGFVFHLDPDTGTVSAPSGIAYFANADCSGDTFVGTSSQRPPLCDGLMPGRLLAVPGADANVGLAGSRLILGDGHLIALINVRAQWTPSGVCQPFSSPAAVCAQHIGAPPFIGTTVPLPIVAN